MLKHVNPIICLREGQRSPLWSEAPDWAQWLVRDPDGWWKWMQNEPKLFSMGTRTTWIQSDPSLDGIYRLVRTSFSETGAARKCLPIKEKRPVTRVMPDLGLKHRRLMCDKETKEAIRSEFERMAERLGATKAGGDGYASSMNYLSYRIDTKAGEYTFSLYDELRPDLITRRVDSGAIPSIIGKFRNAILAREHFGSGWSGKHNFHGIFNVLDLLNAERVISSFKPLA